MGAARSGLDRISERIPTYGRTTSRPPRPRSRRFADAVHADGEGRAGLAGRGATKPLRPRRGGSRPFAKVIVEPFGDIWLRDTGAIVLGTGADRRAQGFGFNGWGGKYDLPGDDSIGERLAAPAGLPFAKADWILEGGAIDGDGSGTVLTTEQCLLNPNRNPGLDKDEVEQRLARDLGCDTRRLARRRPRSTTIPTAMSTISRASSRPGRVAIPEAVADDPNAAAYADAAEALLDADLEVVAIPSPGLVERDGEIVPASYMNFYIGNAAVVVPQYGAANDAAAVEAMQALFPGRRAIGLRADHILTGGGSFHCISQQVPA